MSELLENNIPIFWDINRTSTHNCLFNFIVGNRGGGKSYGAKKRAIENFIKKGEKFGYIRRYEKDLTKSFRQFFKDIAPEFPEYESRVVGDTLYLRRKRGEDEDDVWTDDDIAGYGFILSTADNLKSLPFPDIGILIYDEFIMKEGNQRYLKDEVTKFLELYETIARPGTPGRKEVPVWLLSNAITITNPYFMYFNLKMPKDDVPDKNGKFIWKNSDNTMLVENVKSEGLMALKRATKFGKIIKGTKYEGYSIDNEFFLDSEVFIERRSNGAKHEFNFIYNNNKYGVWYDYGEGKMWVSEATDPYGVTYTITMEDHSPNTMFLKSKTGSVCLKRFVDCYKLGAVRFENMNIKNITYEVIKMILL